MSPPPPVAPPAVPCRSPGEGDLDVIEEGRDLGRVEDEEEKTSSRGRISE